jgi:putative intracellular protease/amidase
MYVFDTLADWEWGYITAEFSSGRFFKKRGSKLPFKFVSNSKKTVRTLGGVPILPDMTIDEANITPDDLLILPGGDTWNDPIHESVLALVEKLLPQGLTVGAICGATAALAQRGLLNSRKHTSNALPFLEQTCPGYKGRALYVDCPAVADGYLITASGNAPLEFAYQVIKKTGLFKPETLEAWYNMNLRKEPRYFAELMNSLA